MKTIKIKRKVEKFFKGIALFGFGVILMQSGFSVDGNLFEDRFNYDSLNSNGWIFSGSSSINSIFNNTFYQNKVSRYDYGTKLINNDLPDKFVFSYKVNIDTINAHGLNLHYNDTQIFTTMPYVTAERINVGTPANYTVISYPFNEDVWYDLEFFVDYTTQKFYLKINNEIYDNEGQGYLFSSTIKPNNIRTRYDAGETGIVYFDDVLIYEQTLDEFYGEQSTSQASTNTELNVLSGELSIEAPSLIDFGEIMVSSSEQIVEINLEDPNYFTIEDLKGSEDGYYTTLSISDLIDNNKVISAQNVEIQTFNVSTLAGSVDLNVITSLFNFSTFDSGSPVVLIERKLNSNGIVGKYGVLPSLKVKVPSYQAKGKYTGTLTYTLIEN